MPLIRTLTEMTYRSGVAPHLYTFVISMDQYQNISVREIITPTGSLCASMALLPEFVLIDIETAICQLRNMVQDTSAMSGFVSFSNMTAQTILFDTAFPDTNYRVAFSLGDFIAVRVGSKTTSGFTVETDVTYTGVIGYEVFVDEPSDAYGTLTFAAESTKAVTFPTVFSSADYRVLFSTEDFISARAINKTANGFDVDLGVSYTGDVGYDVFVEDRAGTLTFAAETTKDVVFPNPFYCDKYRVVFSIEDFIAVKAINKTKAGFTVEVDVTYTGTIGYQIFV